MARDDCGDSAGLDATGGGGRLGGGGRDVTGTVGERSEATRSLPKSRFHSFNKFSSWESLALEETDAELPVKPLNGEESMANCPVTRGSNWSSSLFSDGCVVWEAMNCLRASWISLASMAWAEDFRFTEGGRVTL